MPIEFYIVFVIVGFIIFYLIEKNEDQNRTIQQLKNESPAPSEKKRRNRKRKKRRNKNK